MTTAQKTGALVTAVLAEPRPETDGRRRTRRRPLDLPECGTITGYTKGCGCAPCRDASATARRAQRYTQRTGVKLDKPVPPPRTVTDRVRVERPELNLPQCGTPRGYQMGCGCLPCREAKAKQRKDLYDRRKAEGLPPQPRPAKVPNPLPPDELARLRASVACVGCGAMRHTTNDGKTRIRHKRGCPTARNKENAA